MVRTFAAQSLGNLDLSPEYRCHFETADYRIGGGIRFPNAALRLVNRSSTSAQFGMLILKVCPAIPELTDIATSQTRSVTMP